MKIGPLEEFVFLGGGLRHFGTGLGRNWLKMRLFLFMALRVPLFMVLHFETLFAEVLTELRLANESFLNQDFAQTQRTNFQYLGVSFSNSSKQDSLQVDMNGYFAAGAANMSTLAVNEFFYQWEGFQVGRRRQAWSLLESRWHNGVIEPVNRARPLSPRQQGLTGFFWQRPLGASSLNVLLSPIFLPEFGPAYEIQDGKFVSSDPWFQNPPSKIRIFPNEEPEPLDYSILRPKESKVILQKTLGLQWNKLIDPESSKDFYWSLSYLYKPNNQFAIAYDGYKPSENVGRNRIDLEPLVFYHHVSSLDLSYRYKKTEFGISGVYDVPENSLAPTQGREWTLPLYKPAILLSPFVELDLKYFMMGLSRLETIGGEIVDQGDLANSERSSISQKYPYQTGNQVEIKSYIRTGKRSKLIQSLSYLAGDQSEFEVLKWSPHLHLSSLWHLYAELELISAREPQTRRPNIIYNYADHDRFHLGVGYVF